MDDKLNIILQRLIALPKENEWAEFKRNFHSEDEIGERISALANAAALFNKPFAYLVYGVDNETHQIIGTSFSPSKKMVGNNELENWLVQNLMPHIDFRIYEFIHDGKHVAMFEIPAAEHTPVTYKKVSYIRVGSITRLLKDFPDKERKIWNNRRQFETGIALENCTPADVVMLLDTQSFFDLLHLPYPTTQNAVIERLTTESLLQKTLNGYNITNLGGILFAKNLHDFPTLERKIPRVVQYRGKNKLDTIIDEEFTQGYACGFAALVKYVNDILPHKETIGEAFRSEQRAYPTLAIRELTANALIHQDFYLSGTSVMIEIYSDRIEITNPGTPLIDTERFIDEYRSLNEKLASLLRRMNICEEKGSGIDKVVFQCELYQLPAPLFTNSDIHTKVILYAPKLLRNMDKTDKIRAVYQHACLKWVSNDFMTNQSLRERFKIEQQNHSIASRLIRDALDEKVIKEADTDNKSRKFAKYLPFWA